MDSTIYTLFDGKMKKIGEPRNPNNANFVITCEYGDWSGYRTLSQCEAQFSELESSGKGNFYYSVVER